MIADFGAQFVVPGFVAVDLAQPVRRRRARTATRRRRRARCRPRRPTRERTCWGWPPTGRPPPLSRTSRPPHGAVAPGTPGNASRCRRGTRPRRLRHRSQLGAGHRADQRRGWPHPGSRRRRPSCRRGRRRQPRHARHGARCEGRRRVMRSSRARTPATGSRGPRRSPRGRRAGRRHGSRESGSGGSSFVLVGCRHASIQGSAVLPARMRFSIRRRYAPARSIRACACCSLRTSP